MFCLICLRDWTPERRHLCPNCIIEDCMVPCDDQLAVNIRLCPRGHDGQFELSAKLTHGVGISLTKMAVSRRRVKVEFDEPPPRQMRRCGIMGGSDHVGFSDMVSLQTRMAEAVNVPRISS